MDYFKIGDTIDYTKYNGLVYLLRKFKRLRTSINIGEKNIVNEYGTYRFIGDFTSINGNFILEEDVNIYANDVFKNAEYQFIFNVINQDTSEEINRRVIYKSGDTGDDGILNITLPEDMLNENEVILPEVIIDIFFSTHEYQNGLNSFKTSLTVQHKYLTSGTNKITLTITEEDDTPVDDILTTIYINGIPHQLETDNNGKAEYTYQYTGTTGKVEVKSNGETAVFFDGGINFVYNKFIKKTEVPPDYFAYKYEMELGYNSNGVDAWLANNDVVNFSCEEDNYNIFLDNPKTARTFKGSFISPTQLTELHWTITGDVIAIGPDMFNSLYGLTEIFIPRGIEKIGTRAFYYSTNLESITIPDTVYILGDSCFYASGLEEIKLPASINSIGANAFYKCKIKKYELAWKGNEIIPYNKNKFPVIDETIFKIPAGETENYIAKNYPADRLDAENVYELALETATPVISLGDATSAIATLTLNGEAVVGEELEYTIKHEGTVITTSTATTNSVGEATISYTGAGVGDIIISVSYDDLEETVQIEDCIIYDPLTSNSEKWTIPSSCQTSYDGNGGKFGTATSYSEIKLTDKLTADCSVEFTVVDYYTDAPNSNYPLIIYQYTNGETAPNQAILNGSQTKILGFGNNISGHTLLKNGVYRIEYTSSIIKIYENDVLIATGSNNIGLPTRFEFHIGASSGRWLKIKDVKVKPF